MKVVYVCGKFTGTTAWSVAQNVRAAEEVAFEVALLGAMPLCPHTNTANFSGTISAEFWYAGTLELLRRCDAVILVPGWRASRGALAEIDEAKRRGTPVFADLADLSVWLGAQEPEGTT